MIRSQAKITLLKEFLNNFNTITPIALNNRNNLIFSNGNVTTKPTNSPWVRFWIQNNDVAGQTLGAAPNRRFQRLGMILSQVFLPEGTSTNAGDILCEEIINIFEGNRFGNIVCTNGIYREIGTVEDGYFTYDVTIFYDFDEKK